MHDVFDTMTSDSSGFIQWLDRWLDHRQAGQHEADLTCMETGADGGMRLASLWRAWSEGRISCRRMHIVVCWPERLSSASLAQAFETVSSHSQPANLDELATAWPNILLPGVTRIELAQGRVTLTLLNMTWHKALFQALAQVDLFLLDRSFIDGLDHAGAAPAGQLVRLAAAGATVFSALDQPALRAALLKAGFVPDAGIGQDAGVLIATLRDSVRRRAQRYMGESSVAVVGAGIAGAGIAHALARRGHQVTVFDPLLKLSSAAAHDRHIAAAITPVISADDDFRARLSRAGADRAWRSWCDLPGDARPLRCGTVKLPRDADEWAAWRTGIERLALSPAWAQLLSPADCQARLGYSPPLGACYFPGGMLIRPDRLLPALLNVPGIQTRALGVEVMRRTGDGPEWSLSGASGQLLGTFSQVVVANAVQARGLIRQVQSGPLPRFSTLHAVTGQVSYWPNKALPGAWPFVVDAQGYWLPAVEGMHTAGGTYVPADQARVTEAGHIENLGKIEPVLPPQWAAGLRGVGVAGGWAGWRAIVRGRLPVVGPVPGAPGVWLACGYGSRGLTWSALAGDLIAGALSNEPAILERDLIAALRPC